MATPRYTLICLEATASYHIVAHGWPIDPAALLWASPKPHLGSHYPAFAAPFSVVTTRSPAAASSIDASTGEGGVAPCEQEALPTCRGAWIVDRIALLTEAFAIPQGTLS